MNKNNILLTIVISAVSALSVIGIYSVFVEPQSKEIIRISENTHPVRLTNAAAITDKAQQYFDFTYAAKVTTPAVVHVKSTAVQHNTGQRSRHPFEDFFGDQWLFGQPRQQQPQTASGSGVIISQDGYIITNNHVIQGADEIEITLHDNRSYTAQLIGTDPSTDLALLKIEDSGLEYIPFANSDSVEIGSWVVAVGNPFNLSSTVTAGIVSAKGRNINILQGQSAIESFIQTDAAVNPGNSGGALVDISGNLVGINTAIASPTGSYSGYSFAVPSNLARKVIVDIKEFGIVQRGFLGITIRNVDSKLAEELNLDEPNGVYIDEVANNSAAEDAAIKKGDVIKSINGLRTTSAPELQEVVGRFRPGDDITINYIRDGKLKSTTVKLKNRNQGTELLSKNKIEVAEILGASFTDVDKKELKEMGIEGGVKVNNIKEGKISRYTDMRDGFIITKIDNTPVISVEQLLSLLDKKKGGVMIEGKYPDYPGSYYYAFGL